MGQIIEDVYRVERVIGRGGMGIVYAVRNLRTEGMFAIKVLPWRAARDPALCARFCSEARITSELRHPGIIQVIDFFQLHDGSLCIVTEYLDGEDLSARLRRVGRLALGEALGITRQAAVALHAAHKIGVFHRDLKPSNLFLVRYDLGDEVAEQVKVIDFGVSRIQGSEATPDAHILGTPQYISPEGARGLNRDIDGRSDQYSLAVMLYEMLTGRLPFSARSDAQHLYLVGHKEPAPIGELSPELPEHVRAAISRALSRGREARFDTIVEFVRALEGRPPAASSMASIPPPPSPPPPEPSADTVPGHRRSPRRILIVDDDQALAQVLVEGLEQEGYQCRAAGDPAAALRAFHEFAPDLVLMDLCLPDKLGYHLSWAMKRARLPARCPVILISGLVDEADRRLGRAELADAYLAKPFQLPALLSLIESLLSPSSLSQEVTAPMERIDPA